MKRIVKNLEKLTTPCKPVEFLTADGMNTEELESIIGELKLVLDKKPEILALAAPQIGIDARVFCIRFSDTIKTFINPIITKKSGSILAPETFLNMPGKEILLARPKEITAVYYTDGYKYEDNKFMDAAARLFDQMCQLLDGVLPSELGLVSDVETDGSLADLTDEEFDQVLEIYKQFISTRLANSAQDIGDDENVNKLYNQLRFTESVINGRTQVVAEEKKAPKFEKTKAQKRADLNYFMSRKKK